MIAGALRRSAARMVPMTAWRSYTHIATLDSQMVVCRSALIPALKDVWTGGKGVEWRKLKVEQLRPLPLLIELRPPSSPPPPASFSV